MSAVEALSGGDATQEPVSQAETAPQESAPQESVSQESVPRETEAWYKNAIDPEYHGMIESKNYQDPNSLAKALAHAQKMIGAPADQLIRLPAEGDEEGWNEIYAKLGRPENPDAYEMESLGDEALDGWLKETAYKNNLNGEQLKNLSSSLAEKIQADQQATEEGMLTEASAKYKEIEQSWGSQVENQRALMQAGLAELGISNDVAEGERFSPLQKLEFTLGTEAFVKLAQRIGEKIAEPGFAAGESKPPVKSREALQNEYRELMADPKHQEALRSTDPRARELAFKKQNALAQAAFD